MARGDAERLEPETIVVKRLRPVLWIRLEVLAVPHLEEARGEIRLHGAFARDLDRSLPRHDRAELAGKIEADVRKTLKELVDAEERSTVEEDRTPVSVIEDIPRICLRVVPSRDIYAASVRLDDECVAHKRRNVHTRRTRPFAVAEEDRRAGRSWGIHQRDRRAQNTGEEVGHFLRGKFHDRRGIRRDDDLGVVLSQRRGRRRRERINRQCRSNQRQSDSTMSVNAHLTSPCPCFTGKETLENVWDIPGPKSTQIHTFPLLLVL